MRDIRHEQPWQVGDVMSVFNRLNHPTAGLMRVDGREVSFRCLAGHGETESLWAYVERPTGIDIDPTSPRHIFEQWAERGTVTFAVADADGILDAREAKVGGIPYSELVSAAFHALNLGMNDLDAIGLEEADIS